MFPVLYAHAILFSSGGTIAGLSLGSSLSSLKAKVRASIYFPFVSSSGSFTVMLLWFLVSYRFMHSLFVMTLTTSMILSKACWMVLKPEFPRVILLKFKM